MEIDRHSLAPEVNPDDTISFDEHDFVPHFQRVSISGEDTSGVPLEDLERASRLLIQALELRERYMTMSHQSFPQTAGRFVRARQEKDANVVHHDDKKTIAGELRDLSLKTSFNYFYIIFAQIDKSSINLLKFLKTVKVKNWASLRGWVFLLLSQSLVTNCAIWV